MEYALPPKIPSKYDIIPIHASDRGSFKKCRRKWNWSSPMRNNLVPKVSEGSIIFPLWFGSGIHWALRHYYDPVLPRDPVEVFQTWFDIQWNGGIITEDWLETVYDRKPTVVSKDGIYKVAAGLTNIPGTLVEQGLYRVKGLKDLLPDNDPTRFEEHQELGIKMMEFYRDWAPAQDDFKVLMVEHTFSVPILDNDGEVYKTIDPRDDKIKEVHLRGTQDAVVQDNHTGKYGILEHKSAIRIDDDYFQKLEKDEQCTTYMYAGEREAEEHDLAYKRIDFVLYNAIRKAFPKPPTEVRGGVFSIDRSKESTTIEYLQKFIDDNGIQVIVDNDDKLQSYVNYVRDKGDEQFVRRDPVRRNRAEIRSCGERIYMEAQDMLEDPFIYPNPTGEYGCLKCSFRAPCIAKDDGSDYQLMLEDMFEPNWNR